MLRGKGRKGIREGKKTRWKGAEDMEGRGGKIKRRERVLEKNVKAKEGRRKRG